MLSVVAKEAVIEGVSMAQEPDEQVYGLFLLSPLGMLSHLIFNEMIQNCILLLLLNSLVVTLLPFYYLCEDILDGLILEIIFHHPFS